MGTIDQQEELQRLRTALREAASSLEVIADPGKTPLTDRDDALNLRMYANSRATVARIALLPRMGGEPADGT